MHGARTVLGLCLLVTLFGNIVYVQMFSRTRLYCFAMFSSVNSYRIQATINDDPLTPAEVQQRYGYRATGIEMRSIQHIKNVITGVESRANDHAYVILTYSTDGSPEQQWIAP